MEMVSVIIPTRNRLDFLKEAVASVSIQDYPHRELIIVDDASEDRTWEWLSSLDDPRIRIFRLTQHGERSAARNLGLSKANGEFAMFLDDDDLLVPNALSYLCTGAKRFPAAMAVSGNRLFFDQAGHEYTYPHPRQTVVRKIWRDVLAGWIPQVSQCIIRKSSALEAGGWDPRLTFAEDHALWLRMVSSHSVAVVLPGVVARYRIHGGQSRAARGVRGDRAARESFVRRLPAHLHSDAWRVLGARRLVSGGDGLSATFLPKVGPPACCRHFAGSTASALTADQGGCSCADSSGRWPPGFWAQTSSPGSSAPKLLLDARLLPTPLLET